MRTALRILLLVVALGLLAAPAWAKSKEEHIQEVQALLNSDNVDLLLGFPQILKDSGVSYQQSMVASTRIAMSPGLNDSPELRAMIGVYQFDAAYAAGFGKVREAIGFIEAQKLLMDKTGLQAKLDIAALFPPKLNDLLADPDQVNLGTIKALYAAQAPKFSSLLEQQVGFQAVESAMYGFMLEALYLTTQSILLAGSSGSIQTVMAALEPHLATMVGIYDSFADKLENYKEYVDPENYFTMYERAGWIKPMLELIREKQGDLTPAEIQAIANQAAKERARIVRDY